MLDYAPGFVARIGVHSVAPEIDGFEIVRGAPSCML
jgi:hypothetical protein